MLTLIHCVIQFYIESISELQFLSQFFSKKYEEVYFTNNLGIYTPNDGILTKVVSSY